MDISMDEQARRRRLVTDTRAALRQGKSTDAYLASREAAVAELTGAIRGLMAERGASDPVEVLPELMVRLKEDVVAEAREAARAAAKAELLAMLKKVTAP